MTEKEYEFQDEHLIFFRANFWPLMRGKLFSASFFVVFFSVSFWRLLETQFSKITKLLIGISALQLKFLCFFVFLFPTHPEQSIILYRFEEIST